MKRSVKSLASLRRKSARWTTDLDLRLLMLWPTDSAAVIAIKLGSGKTEHSVRARVSQLRRRGVQIPPRSKELRTIHSVKTEEDHEPSGHECTVMDLDAGQCTKIVGSSPLGYMVMFCGRPSVDGSSYCKHHQGRAI